MNGITQGNLLQSPKSSTRKDERPSSKPSKVSKTNNKKSRNGSVKSGDITKKSRSGDGNKTKKNGNGNEG